MPEPEPFQLPQRTLDPDLAIRPGDELVRRGPRMDFVLRPVPTRSHQTIIREVVVHPGAVLILAVHPDGRMVFIRNRRHTVGAELWELPAGTLGTGEDPAACAARELTEETGFVAGTITPLGWFYTSPGVLTEKMYAFVATDLTPGPQALEDNELIRVVALDRRAVEKLILENELVDAKTLATLLRYWMTKR